MQNIEECSNSLLATKLRGAGQKNQGIPCVPRETTKCCKILPEVGKFYRKNSYLYFRLVTKEQYFFCLRVCRRLYKKPIKSWNNKRRNLEIWFAWQNISIRNRDWESKKWTHLFSRSLCQTETRIRLLMSSGWSSKENFSSKFGQLDSRWTGVR